MEKSEEKKSPDLMISNITKLINVWQINSTNRFTNWLITIMFQKRISLVISIYTSILCYTRKLIKEVKNKI